MALYLFCWCRRHLPSPELREAEKGSSGYWTWNSAECRRCGRGHHLSPTGFRGKLRWRRDLDSAGGASGS
jgi:hypothetical protein